MKSLILIVVWGILLVLCWPLALLVALLLPFLWLLSLPFRLAGICVEATLSLIRALLFLPARIVGRIFRP
jgi:hypothetical protein